MSDRPAARGSRLHLAAAALARPRWTIVLMALLTLAAAPGLLRLELRTGGQALVPPGDPAVAADREIRARFGLRDPVVVLVETDHPDGIYNPRTLRFIRELTRRLARLDRVGPEDVTSLATEASFRAHREEPRFRPFLDELPSTPEELARLRADVEAVGLFRGTLVAEGGRAAAVLVGVPAASSGPGAGDRRLLTRRIAAAVAALEERESGSPRSVGRIGVRGSKPDRLSVVGAPVAEALLGDHVLEDLALLLPAAIALIGAVLWLGCRRSAGVLLGLAQVGACLVWTFGLMGTLGAPVYLTTAILPVILTCVGLADEIHLFWRYQRLLGEAPAGQPDGGRGPAVERTFRELARPVALTSVTTAVGFLSFLASPVPAVRSFGLFAACGVLYCLLWSLTAVPAALALLPARLLRQPAGRRPARSFLEAAAAPLLRHRGATLAVLGALTLALGAGALRLTVQDSWVAGFSPESPFRRATERADRLLAGTHTLLLELSFPERPAPEAPGAPWTSGPLLEPAAVEAVGELERFLRTAPGVGTVLGLHGHLTTVRYLRSGLREDRRAIPERPEWVYQLVRELALFRGEARRRELIDDELRRTVVTVLVRDANYRDTERLLAAIRRYEEERLAPLGVGVRLGGDLAVSQAMIPAIVRTQVASLGLALAGALLVASLLYASPAAGLVVIAPVTGAVLWVFGLMGWLGAPLGVATSMFCAVTLGIGIDYGIHLYERFSRLRAAGRAAPALAAVAEAGPAIVADAAAIALGFGVLAFSRVPANRSLGLLVAGALAVSCLLTLAGQAAWLAGRRAPEAESAADVPTS